MRIGIIYKYTNKVQTTKEPYLSNVVRGVIEPYKTMEEIYMKEVNKYFISGGRYFKRDSEGMPFPIESTIVPKKIKNQLKGITTKDKPRLWEDSLPVKPSYIVDETINEASVVKQRKPRIDSKGKPILYKSGINKGKPLFEVVKDANGNANYVLDTPKDERYHYEVALINHAYQTGYKRITIRERAVNPDGEVSDGFKSSITLPADIDILKKLVSAMNSLIKDVEKTL